MFATDQLLVFNWLQAKVYVFLSYGSTLKYRFVDFFAEVSSPLSEVN